MGAKKKAISSVVKSLEGLSNKLSLGKTGEELASVLENLGREEAGSLGKISLLNKSGKLSKSNVLAKRIDNVTNKFGQNGYSNLEKSEQELIEKLGYKKPSIVSAADMGANRDRELLDKALKGQNGPVGINNPDEVRWAERQAELQKEAKLVDAGNAGGYDPLEQEAQGAASIGVQQQEKAKAIKAGKEQQARAQYVKNADAAANSGGYDEELVESISPAKAEQTIEQKAVKATSIDNGSSEAIQDTKVLTDDDLYKMIQGDEKALESGMKTYGEQASSAIDNNIANAKADNTLSIFQKSDNAVAYAKKAEQARLAEKLSGYQDQYKAIMSLTDEVQKAKKLDEFRKTSIKDVRSMFDNVKDANVGVSDYIYGNNIHGKAMAVGTLGFAANVAFGGPKSNAELYSNPF